MLATPAGVNAIGLVQKPASTSYGLSQAFLLIGDRGASRPDPPLVAGLFRLARGLFCSVFGLLLVGVAPGF